MKGINQFNGKDANKK